MYWKNENTFCETEPVIKPYLKMLANLLHGGKHAVDQVEQIACPDNEHSMTAIIVTSTMYLQ